MVKIAVVQLKPDQFSDDKTVDAAINFIKDAVKFKTEVVCFPEHWLSNSIEMSDKLVKVLRNAASTYKMFIISGANFEKKNGKIFINSLVFNSDGNIIANQTKNHLFKNEKKTAIPGRSYSIFNYKDIKAGIMICYDAVFPEVARILALRGADIIFVPSRIRKDGIEAWHLYLKTRCLENRVAIVGINIADPPKYPGNSILIIPEKNKDPEINIVYPKILKIGKEEPQMIIADFNLASLKSLREERLKDRRPEIYSNLIEL